ncbi:MAG: DNA polymerase III subunit delta [Alphaproteobacteria bacterium]
MIKKYDIFLQEKISHNNIFLFYGVNQGRIDECVNYVKKDIKEKDPNTYFIYIYSDDLKIKNFKQILSETSQDDIFGKKCCIIFLLTEIKQLNEIQKALQEESLKFNSLIFKTSQLPKKNLFRTLFEKSQDKICVPCYEETLMEKKTLIRNYLLDEQIKISENQIEYFSSNFSNDRLEIINELKKLVIFFKENSDPNLDSLNVISDSFDSDMNKLTFGLASRNFESFWSEYSKLVGSEINEIRLTTFFLQHFEKLLNVHNKISEGFSTFNALKSLNPPIFFKHEKEFLYQINLWSKNQVLRVIKNLHACQVSILKGNNSSKSFFLYQITKIFNFS